MPSKSKFPSNPTANDVRTALGLPVQRGQLSQAHIDAYNKGKRANKRYVRGAGVAQRQARTEARAALVAQGVAGKRGPLSAAAKESLAQSKG